MSYSSPYLQGVGKYFGCTVIIKCLINSFDINLKGERSKLPWHKILKRKTTLIKTMYYLNQINCGAHKYIGAQLEYLWNLSARAKLDTRNSKMRHDSLPERPHSFDGESDS